MHGLGEIIIDRVQLGMLLPVAIQEVDPLMVKLSAGGARIECAPLIGEDLVFVMYWRGFDDELGTSDDISIVFDTSK